MSILVNRVHRGVYLDSVALMRISTAVGALGGVEAAALMIGTPANIEILAASGLLDADGRTAVANDLVIAIRAGSAAALHAALDAAEQSLRQPAPVHAGSSLLHVRRLDTALARLPEANLALISVPGEFAAYEASRALAAGLHVVMFSDNVALEDERALKEDARRRGLMMMGPDCGTCFIAGVPIAFANAVPAGPIGIVSASGTGLQEVATLLARAGMGIAHGIGVGGRDLSAAIGGISTLMAIDALEADPAVERIVVISKPPADAVAAKLLARIAASGKPVVVCFMGHGRYTLPANAVFADTLRGAVEHCIGPIAPPDWTTRARSALSARAGAIRGLFCGGTLCAEAQGILMNHGLDVSSNAPVPGARQAQGAGCAGHLLLDLGDDEYTRGRPHPMIDPSVRTAHIAAALADPRIAILLLDVVIGYGAHANPAGLIVDALKQRASRAAFVVASVTGTEQDPQCYSAQVQALERAGVVVAPSNAHAAELAAALAAR